MPFSYKQKYGYAMAENDRKDAQIARLVEALKSAVKIANEAAEEWDKAPAGMRAGKILLALAGHRRGYRPDTDAIHAALRSATETPSSTETKDGQS